MKNVKFDEYFDVIMQKKPRKQKVRKEIREIDALSEIEIIDEIIKNNFKIGYKKRITNKKELINYKNELEKFINKLK